MSLIGLGNHKLKQLNLPVNWEPQNLFLSLKQCETKIWFSDTSKTLSSKNTSFCHCDNLLKCQTSTLLRSITNSQLFILKPSDNVFVLVPREIRTTTIQNIRHQYFKSSILLNCALISNHIFPFVLVAFSWNHERQKTLNTTA